MSIPDIQMTERCATCAYRAGTPASRSILTLAKAQACLWAAEPFVCHEAKAISDEAMCAGWVAALQNQLALSREIPAWKRRLAGAMLDLIEKVENGASEQEVLPLLEAALKEGGKS